MEEHSITQEHSIMQEQSKTATQKQPVHIINIINRSYLDRYTHRTCKWFKYKKNKEPINIAPMIESISQGKIFKFRRGPLYFTFIDDGEIRQLGYCVDKDHEYMYFTSFINETDDQYHHRTFALPHHMLHVLYIADY